MPGKDYRDIFRGAVLVLLGGGAAIHALATLNLGTVAQMGPGMFPAALGALLGALGVAILVPALFRSGEIPSVDLRSLAAVSASILVFALIVQPFGLIPAVVALTFVASWADSRLSLLGTTILAACLSVGATLIFQIGLGLQFSAFNWPW